MAEIHVPQLRIKVEGPAVGPARLAARDFWQNWHKKLSKL